MNSVRYICVDCGTHFDLPVTYVNRKVRCKCGYVDQAIPTEVRDDPPAPSMISRPAPQYQPQYVPRGYAPRSGYSPKRKSGLASFMGNRSIIVIIENVLGLLMVCFLVYVAYKQIQEIRQLGELWDFLVPDKVKAKIYAIIGGVSVAALLALLAQYMLFMRARSGIAVLVISHLIATGAYLLRAYVMCVDSINLFKPKLGEQVGLVLGVSAVIFCVLILPLFFVNEGLE